MNKEVIKEIILNRQREVLDVQLTLRNFTFETAVCYVLTGIRRAGKSYMLYQDIQRNIRDGIIDATGFLYVNFEDERLSDITAPELGLLLDCYAELYGERRPFVYLDEIQNVYGWEKFVRRLADSRYRVMVTGSNAKMLSTEISTTLGGRFIPKDIHPFTFAEYLDYRQVLLGRNWVYDSQERTMVFRLFGEYFRYGGFAATFDLRDKEDWLLSLYHKILLGDIVARGGIRGDRVIRMLTRKIAESVMQPTTATRLKHIIDSTGDKISMPTLADYLQMMREAYLVFDIPNRVSTASERQTVAKRYFADCGLLGILVTRGETKMLENLVAVTLYNRYSCGHEEPNLFYYSRGVEVDFYVQSEQMAIQVCYDLSDSNTRDRELAALDRVAQVLPVSSAMVITYNEEAAAKTPDGMTVTVIPVWKWLLV